MKKQVVKIDKVIIWIVMGIFLIALGIIVIGLIIFIIFYLKKPRKNRAAELNDDNYEYFPNE